MQYSFAGTYNCTCTSIPIMSLMPVSSMPIGMHLLASSKAGIKHEPFLTLTWFKYLNIMQQFIGI